MGLATAAYLLFLSSVAIVHALLPPRGRTVLLLCVSLAFYAFSSVNYLVLLLILCVLNHVAVRSLSCEPNERRRNVIFYSVVTLNLAVLLLFKYAIRFIGGAMGRFAWSGEVQGWWLQLAAPLGLSYFTFQMLSCVTDAYRRNWSLNGGLGQFVLFGFFFPQISSGPIPRAERLFPQLAGVKPTAEDRLIGMRAIAYGLFKKCVIANRLTEYVDMVFSDNPGLGTVPTFLGCCFNALQLYADFSGYVDIAIGSARFLGIRLDPNFDRPFVSTSVTEFWRRWHMTLSFWLRDYLYMPLVIRIRNLGRLGIAVAMIFTFAICGIWHAATWTFLLFGVAQGVAMSAEMLTKSWRAKRLKPVPKRWVTSTGWLYTVGFFVLSQVLFRSVDLAQAGHVYAHLFRLRLPGGIGEICAFKGPAFFAFDFVTIGLWAAVASCMPKVNEHSTPWFILICAVLILLFGRLGSAHFIYAGF